MGESVQFQLMGEFICVVGKTLGDLHLTSRIHKVAESHRHCCQTWLCKGFALSSRSFQFRMQCWSLVPHILRSTTRFIGLQRRHLSDAVHSGVRIEGVSIAIAIANSVTIAAILLMGNVFGLLSYMVMLITG
jgi:hypothetical protein